MIDVRPFAQLGRFDNDWLAARYHFSFAGYHDPARGGVGPLLVWNDDTIQPETGFDPHGHRDPSQGSGPGEPDDGIDYEVVVGGMSEIARLRSDRMRDDAAIAESFVAVTTTPKTPRPSR